MKKLGKIVYSSNNIYCQHGILKCDWPCAAGMNLSNFLLKKVQKKEFDFGKQIFRQVYNKFLGSASSKKCWFDKYNFSSIVYRFGKFHSLESHCPVLLLYIFLRIFLELAHSIFNGPLSSPLMKMRILKILLPILFLPGSFVVLSISWY